MNQERPLTNEVISQNQEEPISIAEIISQTVENYLERGNLTAPCELVVNIETKTSYNNPEIQVEPAIIDDDDSLKATVKLPGKEDKSVEFKVTVPKLQNEKSIDVADLADVISRAFDRAILTTTTTG